MGVMNKRLFALAALAFSAAPALAFAGATNFTLVNGTDAALSAIAIKRTGTSDWKPLSSSASAGAANSVNFSDPDCAFDLKASVAGGGTALWSGVNLCGTSRLTLRRRPSGETWVDYD